MHYGFHQKEQDTNSNGDNCSFIIRIRKSRYDSSLNYLKLFDKYLPNETSKQKLSPQK